MRSRAWGCRFALASHLALAAAASCVAAPQAVDHTAWDQLLHRHVSNGLVDYQGLLAQEAALDAYLASLHLVKPEQLASRDEQLAFWINAYNAYVVKGVLEHYPIRSVKDVKGFFDRIQYPIGGQALTLNEIEAKGRAFGDWRIHFAVVCASSSCPLLRAEAYEPSRLDAQLNEQTTVFLRDAQRGVQVEKSILFVSKIFEWYTMDFVPTAKRGIFHRLTTEQLFPVIQPYLDPKLAQWIELGRPELAFLPYDWTLNDQAR